MKILSYDFNTITEVKAILQKARASEEVISASSVACAVYVNASDRLLAEEIISLFSNEAPDIHVVGITASTKIIGGVANVDKRVISFICMKSSFIKILSYDFTRTSAEYASKDFSDKVNSITDVAAARVFVTDSLSSRIEDFLSGIELKTPSFCCAGSIAADDQEHLEYSKDYINRRFVFSSKVMDSGVVAVIFHGASLHAWQISNYGMHPSGLLHTFTAVDTDHYVTEIDGISTDDFYRKYLGVSTFSRDFVSNVINMPFLIKRDGAELPRSVLYVREDGGLYLDSLVREGEQFQFSFGSLERMLNQSYINARNLSEKRPDAVLMSMCGIREVFLGSHEQTELDYYRFLGADVLGTIAFGEVESIGTKVHKTEFSLVAVSMREGEPDEKRLNRFDMLTPPEETDVFSPMDAISTFIAQSSKEYAELKEKEKEREMNRKIEIEKAKNDAKSAFLSNISHEIRTPINAILGFSEMIIREEKPEEKQLDNAFESESFNSLSSDIKNGKAAPVSAKGGTGPDKDERMLDYALNIKSAGNILLTLVNDILDYSRIEAGGMKIIPVEYSLSTLIDEIVILIRGKAEEKGLKLNVKADPQLPDILFGDMNRIRQVLVNILNNAVKYTEKGSVTFSVSNAGEEDDKIDLAFHVVDTGIGIRKEDMEKLFKPFERIEEERNRNIEGTGLGMSITINLLKMMGSSLLVDSIYGEGSDFHFIIRQGIRNRKSVGDCSENAKSKRSEQAGKEEALSIPGAKILFVDDSSFNLRIAGFILKKTGAEVTNASDGREAVRLAEKDRFDIIFMDQQMPVMDGTKAMKVIRRLPADSPNHNTPIIVVTGEAEDGDRERFIAEGFTDYLTKPYVREEMEGMLRKYLS